MESAYEDANSPLPIIVAQTSDLNQSVNSLTSNSHKFFKSLQWSDDGTTILASLSNNTLQTYIPPPDLLTPPSDSPHQLEPYTKHILPEPAYATLIHPAHSLQSPETCLALASVRNLPLRLFSTIFGTDEGYHDDDDSNDDDNDSTSSNSHSRLSTPITSALTIRQSGILASYPLVSPTTEAFLGVHSLSFGSDGDFIYAGADGLIAAFDVHRPGEGPVSVMRTSKGRQRRSKTSSIGDGGVTTAAGFGDEAGRLKGIVSAMDVSCDRTLAAGTFGRWLGLYNGLDESGVVATFPLQDQGREKVSGGGVSYGGGGVTEVKWSDCGRYLIVAERNSDGVSVWDIRGSGRRLAWLRGRKARTPQRMGIGVSRGTVWAGGTDGLVRTWDNVGLKEGDIEPTVAFSAHGDVVSGLGVHPCGGVLATASGQRHAIQRPLDTESDVENSENSSEDDRPRQLEHGRDHVFDSTLRIWALWYPIHSYLREIFSVGT